MFLRLFHFEQIDRRISSDPQEAFYAMRARYRCNIGMQCATQRRTRLVMELTAAITFVATWSLLRRPNESSRQQPTLA